MMLAAYVWPPSLLIALLVSGLANDALKHRDVLGTTRLTLVRRVVLGNLVAALVSFLAVLAGTTLVFLPVAVLAGDFTLRGAEPAVVYVVWTVTILYMWTSLVTFLHTLLKSRWATIVVFALVSIGVFRVLPFPLTSPFAPFGHLPFELLLSSLVAGGASLVAAGGTSFLFSRWPEWVGVTSRARPLVLAGMIITGSGVLAISILSHPRTAPFGSTDLSQGRAFMSQPYIWDSEGNRLIDGSQYMALRLPAGSPLPGWLENLESHGRNVHIYELDLPLERILLILIYPDGKDYPDELRAAAAGFRDAVHPLVEGARLWMAPNGVRLVVVPERGPPHDIPLSGGVHVLSGHLLIQERMVTGWTKRERTRALWGAAWGLANAAGLGPSERAYLALYLMMHGGRPDETEKALAYFRASAEWVQKALELHQKGRREDIERLPGVRFPHTWDLNAGLRAADADELRVLEHWQRGEEMGHEKHIGELLGEGQGD
jgi:hypothetical protein